MLIGRKCRGFTSAVRRYRCSVLAILANTARSHFRINREISDRRKSPQNLTLTLQNLLLVHKARPGHGMLSTIVAYGGKLTLSNSEGKLRPGCRFLCYRRRHGTLQPAISQFEERILDQNEGDGGERHARGKTE